MNLQTPSNTFISGQSQPITFFFCTTLWPRTHRTATTRPPYSSILRHMECSQVNWWTDALGGDDDASRYRGGILRGRQETHGGSHKQCWDGSRKCGRRQHNWKVRMGCSEASRSNCEWNVRWRSSISVGDDNLSKNCFNAIVSFWTSVFFIAILPIKFVVALLHVQRVRVDQQKTSAHFQRKGRLDQVVRASRPDCSIHVHLRKTSVDAVIHCEHN